MYKLGSSFNCFPTHKYTQQADIPKDCIYTLTRIGLAIRLLSSNIMQYLMYFKNINSWNVIYSTGNST